MKKYLSELAILLSIIIFQAVKDGFNPLLGLVLVVIPCAIVLIVKLLDIKKLKY